MKKLLITPVLFLAVSNVFAILKKLTFLENETIILKQKPFLGR